MLTFFFTHAWFVDWKVTSFVKAKNYCHCKFRRFVSHRYVGGRSQTPEKYQILRQNHCHKLRHIFVKLSLLITILWWFLNIHSLEIIFLVCLRIHLTSLLLQKSKRKNQKLNGFRDLTCKHFLYCQNILTLAHYNLRSF